MRLNIHDGKEILKQYQGVLRSAQNSNSGSGRYRDRDPDPDSVRIRQHLNGERNGRNGSETIEILGTLGQSPRLKKTSTRRSSTWTQNGHEAATRNSQACFLFEIQPDGMLLYEVESKERQVTVHNPDETFGRAPAFRHVDRSVEEKHARAKMLIHPQTGVISLLELEIDA